MLITERAVYAEYGRTLVIRPAEEEDRDALFEKVCAEFENTHIEQDAQGNVLIMAPAGGESSYQNTEISAQLHLWAKQDGRGRSFDSSVLFILPDSSRLGPDACWVSNERLESLTKAERQRFLRIVPEFVIELKSPSDRFSDLQAKMQDWRRNGVEVGWLIHPGKQLGCVYRKQSPEMQAVTGSSIRGEGPVSGFTLDLTPIWAGLAF